MDNSGPCLPKLSPDFRRYQAHDHDEVAGWFGQLERGQDGLVPGGERGALGATASTDRLARTIGERGRFHASGTKLPTIAVLAQPAKVLGVSVAELLTPERTAHQLSLPGVHVGLRRSSW